MRGQRAVWFIHVYMIFLLAAWHLCIRSSLALSLQVYTWCTNQNTKKQMY